ncbi:MAG: T9SS type A sorting domain-containing protein [Ignavibacteriales bacterium]|nr:hypothetical protein [Ignavibacteriaceae bacterium]QOJ28771.1 MAG: T9SS type A sorting domain-containing protein [Ignavibacteriales bacterium]
MKNLLIIVTILLTQTILHAQASLYFPSAPGQKWYFKTTPVDTLNNPQDSLSTYRIDSFAVASTHQGLAANVVLSKNGLFETVPFQPYTDTSYINLDGNNGRTYISFSGLTSLLGAIDTTGIDSILGTGIGSLLSRLASFDGWYNAYRFNNTVNSTYTYFQYDTTITIDTITLPMRFELRGRRIADAQLVTEIGTFQTKRFVNSFVLSYLLGVPPFVLPVGILTIRDSIWFAPEKWIVQSHIPTSGIDLSIFNLPSFTLPGVKITSIPEIIVTGVEEHTGDKPSGFELLQNFPNPFNPETTVRFTLSRAGSYSLRLFSSSGEYISDIGQRIYAQGTHQEVIRLQGLASGIYILRLEGEGYRASLKLTLMK